MARSRRRSARTNKDPSAQSSRSNSPVGAPSSSSNDDRAKCPNCPAKATNEDKAKWIMCDACKTWFHWNCVSTSEDLDLIDKWFCTSCLSNDSKRAITTRAPARKSDRKRPPRDYANLNAGVVASDPNRWLAMMQDKSIKNDSFRHMKGAELSLKWLADEPGALQEPIIIEEPEGLGMKMPENDFTVSDVVEMLGAQTPVEVMDVAKQSSSPSWTLERWRDYFNSAPESRDNIYNVISLEVSGTPLADRISPPRLVQELDWVENYWPSSRRGKGHVYPKVQLYCLMGVQSAWTDWHIDFAGSSVYYHILRGSKVFYFIRPSAHNLAAYERWSGSDIQNNSWLGDMCDEVVKVELTTGNTMIIPSGWIHSVHTPRDTLVFGGNFLHSYDMQTQLKIRNIEIATHVPKRFRFPMFSRLCWYVGEAYVTEMRNGATFPLRILSSICALADFLVSEARLLERGSEAQQKDKKEQVPSDRVKDAPALARELRWRSRQAAGHLSDDEESTSVKPKAINGHARKRKRTGSPAPIDEPVALFKNYRPRTWDSVKETFREENVRTLKYGRPGELEDLALRWREWKAEEDTEAECATISRNANVVVRLRHTNTGLERERIERDVEVWDWR